MIVSSDDAVAARRLDPVAVELAEHAEGVEHGLGDAVGREVAEAVEPGLAVEQEGPGHGAVDLDAVLAAELVGADDVLDEIDAVERAVAVGVLRMDAGRAGGAALGVGFADHRRGRP